MLDLFELTFLLSTDDETQLRRLDEPSTASRNAAQREQIMRGRRIFEREAIDAGAVSVDGRLPIAAVADVIVGQVARPGRG